MDRRNYAAPGCFVAWATSVLTGNTTAEHIDDVAAQQKLFETAHGPSS
jgi:hypothetical protein